MLRSRAPGSQVGGTAGAWRTLFILGGARSGKSRFAERVLAGFASKTYIATAQGFDDEMRERILAHQARRNESWSTADAPIHLSQAIESAAGQPVLVDCLTLWLTNLMLAEHDIEAATEGLVATLKTAPGPLVLVSNEVGLGLVPDTPLGRRFRDAQGRLNQTVAANVDTAVFVAAGLPMTLKGIL
jgi:adenosylcobinamide kinase/adenosylcobinamide-phosphate guanylyltransferase